MENKRLQWLKGDYKGTVENISKTEDSWTYFQSGRRIKTELIDEYMIPLNNNGSSNIPNTNQVSNYKPSYNFSGDSDNNDIITDPETGEVINVKQLRSSESPKKPKKAISSLPTEEIKDEYISSKKPESPVTILINKSNKDKVKVKYEFEIEIPKKDVYNIINSSFDINLNEEIIDVVLASIDNKALKDSVKEEINNTIKSYYNEVK